MNPVTLIFEWLQEGKWDATFVPAKYWFSHPVITVRCGLATIWIHRHSSDCIKVWWQMLVCYESKFLNLCDPEFFVKLDLIFLTCREEALNF